MTKKQASDTIGDKQYQIVKLSSGAEGVDGELISNVNPLPVVETATSGISIGDTVMAALSSMLLELQILNKNISNITGEVVDPTDLDRRNT